MILWYMYHSAEILTLWLPPAFHKWETSNHYRRTFCLFLLKNGTISKTTVRTPNLLASSHLVAALVCYDSLLCIPQNLVQLFMKRITTSTGEFSLHFTPRIVSGTTNLQPASLEIFPPHSPSCFGKQFQVTLSARQPAIEFRIAENKYWFASEVAWFWNQPRSSCSVRSKQQAAAAASECHD